MSEEVVPLFLRISQEVEDQIVNGSLLEGSQAPSTNELASFYRVNPATAAKGMKVLLDEGILTKQRGLGLFVAEGARTALLERRRKGFTEKFVRPLLREAGAIGLNAHQVVDLVRAECQKEGDKGNLFPNPNQEPAQGSISVGQNESTSAERI